MAEPDTSTYGPGSPMPLLHALMDLQKAAPLSWDVDTDDRLTISASLTPDQANFLRAGRRMFEPIEPIEGS